MTALPQGVLWRHEGCLHPERNQRARLRFVELHLVCAIGRDDSNKRIDYVLLISHAGISKALLRMGGDYIYCVPACWYYTCDKVRAIE